MVRDGKPYDLDTVTDMSRQFWKLTAYTEPFDAAHARAMAEAALEHGLLAVLEVEGQVRGFCAALKFPLLANAATLQATEIAWWVDPDARQGRNGIALMKHMEDLCRDQGVKYLNMVVMESCNPEVGAAIYEARGYSKLETTYMRVL